MGQLVGSGRQSGPPRAESRVPKTLSVLFLFLFCFLTTAVDRRSDKTRQEHLPILRAPACRVFPDHLITFQTPLTIWLFSYFPIELPYPRCVHHHVTKRYVNGMTHLRSPLHHGALGSPSAFSRSVRNATSPLLSQPVPRKPKPSTRHLTALARPPAIRRRSAIDLRCCLH